jgi:hypothetical protein
MHADPGLEKWRWAFKEGKPGRFGEIENFHSYEAQDEDRHGIYDQAPDVKRLDPLTPKTFDGVVGGRDAIDQCAQLATFWKQGAKWEGPELVQEFLDTKVFKLAKTVGKSDTKTDESMGPLKG